MKNQLSLAGLRILVVEDVFLIADELVHLLRSWNCEVVGPASNLGEALDLSEDPQIDVALLDVNLGEQLVFPVARKCVARNLPFLFLTAYSTLSAFPPEFHAVPRLAKPLVPEVLAVAIILTIAAPKVREEPISSML